MHTYLTEKHWRTGSHVYMGTLVGVLAQTHITDTSIQCRHMCAYVRKPTNSWPYVYMCACDVCSCNTHIHTHTHKRAHLPLSLPWFSQAPTFAVRAPPPLPPLQNLGPSGTGIWGNCVRRLLLGMASSQPLTPPTPPYSPSPSAASGSGWSTPTPRPASPSWLGASVTTPWATSWSPASSRARTPRIPS